MAGQKWWRGWAFYRVRRDLGIPVHKLATWSVREVMETYHHLDLEAAIEALPRIEKKR